MKLKLQAHNSRETEVTFHVLMGVFFKIIDVGELVQMNGYFINIEKSLSRIHSTDITYIIRSNTHVVGCEGPRVYKGTSPCFCWHILSSVDRVC